MSALAQASLAWRSIREPVAGFCPLGLKAAKESGQIRPSYDTAGRVLTAQRRSVTRDKKVLSQVAVYVVMRIAHPCAQARAVIRVDRAVLHIRTIQQNTMEWWALPGIRIRMNPCRPAYLPSDRLRSCPSDPKGCSAGCNDNTGKEEATFLAFT